MTYVVVVVVQCPTPSNKNFRKLRRQGAVKLRARLKVLEWQRKKEVFNSILSDHAFCTMQLDQVTYEMFCLVA